MNQPLSEMFRYNRWANLELFQALRSLGDVHLDARVAGASGSIREVLLHIAGGQQTLVLRTKGRQHEGEWNRGSAWPGFEVLLEVVRQSSDDLLAIAERLERDRQVVLPWEGREFGYPLSFFLVHAIEHGVEHRTEVKLVLAQLGVETPDLDAWNYATAAGYGREVNEGRV